MGAAPDWLTRRPIAHRGLHDAAAGIVENSAAAVAAAIARGFAIEVDVQRSADGEAMVFHDFTLERLTSASGPLAARHSEELAALPFRSGTGGMMRLADLFSQVRGQVPLLVEIKSDFSGDTRLAGRAATLAAAYDGPVALMSFDPRMVSAVRRTAPAIVRGIVAEFRYDAGEWAGLSAFQRLNLGGLLHWPASRFQFLAYRVADLGRPPPRLARALGLPVLAWTVRTPEDRRRAGARADQMIFEGFVP